MSDSIYPQEIKDSVASLYIAFFGRGPDAGGFDYWCRELTFDKVSPFKTAQDFALSREWKTTYGSLGPAEQVNLFYQNVFGRDADAGGLAYWVNNIASGLPFSAVAYQIIWAAYLGGPNVNPNDHALVNNKIDVAEYFATELKSNDFNIALTAYEGVTVERASVDAAKQRLSLAVNPPSQPSQPEQPEQPTSPQEPEPSSPEPIVGTSGDDELQGSSENDTITSSGGTDTIAGGGGNDIFNVNGGSATISDLQTGDSLVVTNGATATANNVSDFVATSVTRNVGSTAILKSTAGGSTVDMRLATVANETSDGFVLDGSAGVDRLFGSSANDTITGGGGADELKGGAGDDTFLYANAAELLASGALVDSTVSGGDGTDRISVANGLNVVATDSWGDASSIEELYVTGTASSNIVLGTTAETAGIETINISSSTTDGNVVDVSSYTSLDVTIVGSTANTSELLGGAGNDTITGGGGADELKGGAGDDTYVYTGTSDVVAGETITELPSGGVDRIRVQGETNFTAMSAVSFEGIEELEIAGTHITTFAGEQLTGKTLSLLGTSGVQSLVVNATAGGMTDLSNLSAGQGWTPGSDSLSIWGSELADTIVGSATDDWIQGGGGADSLDGGGGTDTFFYSDITTSDAHGLSNIAGIAVNLSDNDISAEEVSLAMGPPVVLGGGDQVQGPDLAAGSAGYLATSAANSTTDMVRVRLSGFEDVMGSSLSDYIVGSDTDNFLDGSLGNDVLVGGLGSDSLMGGAGDDVYVYNSIAELFDPTTNQVIDIFLEFAGQGDDSLRLVGPFEITRDHDFARISQVSIERMTVAASSEDYIITLHANTAAVLPGLKTIDLSGDTIAAGANRVDLSLVNGEYTILGSSGDDRLTGSGGSDSISGGEGNDTIEGGSGSDSLYGGAGDDVFLIADELHHRFSTEVIDGGQGTDTLRFTATDGSTLVLQSGTSVEQARISAADGTNAGTTNEGIDASSVTTAISLFGNDGDNALTGNDRGNLIEGADGADTLRGAAGIDTIVGGDGNDVIEGGADADSLIGGDGDDTFF